MGSPEYHRCMSEAYLTRALLWAFEAAYVSERVTQPYGAWVAVAIAALAVGDFICSYVEHRRAG